MIKVFTTRRLAFTNAEGAEETVGIGFGQVSDSCKNDRQFINALSDGCLKVFETLKEGEKIEEAKVPETVGEALNLLTVAKLAELAISKKVEMPKAAKKVDYIIALSEVVTLDELLK